MTPKVLAPESTESILKGRAQIPQFDGKLTTDEIDTSDEVCPIFQE